MGQSIAPTSNHFVHGHAGNTKSPTYKTWRSMKLRCTNPSNASYKNYGAKGVTYCERWEVFANFLADMGERPEGMSLDRYPDKAGNYRPNNCRWATYKQQSQERSITVWVTHDGKTQCLSDWAAETGLNLTTIKYRLDAGWKPERALTTPPSRRRATATSSLPASE